MSSNYPKSPRQRRSGESFAPLNRAGGETAIDIPMHHVTTTSSAASGHSTPNEKAGFVNRPAAAGQRRSMKPGYAGAAAAANQKNLAVSGQNEEISLNKMGKFYEKFLSISIVTRYFVYVLPLGLLLAIPIIIGATAAKKATIGPAYHKGGVPIVWFFAWLEVCWVGLWVSKIFAHWLPGIFQFFCGIVSSGVRKYALVIKALELPLSLVGWALISLATFQPICTQTPNSPDGDPLGNTAPHWISVMQHVLAAALIASIVFLVERIIIHLLSISYHRKQFDERIKDSKHQIHLLGLLYDASRTMFPAYCPEFAEEDEVIHDSIEINIGNGKKGKKGKNSGSATPMQFVRDAGKIGDKLTSAFGNMAQEVTGKTLFNPESAHSIVVEALEKNRSAEALARRLWLSFVIEGQDALYQDDVIEVLGQNRGPEAEECFTVLDRDGNGDVSLDEMILTVTEFGRERHAIASSMHDVDSAINVLDRLLLAIVLLAVVLIFVAFLNQSFVTTLATTGTALLSLSFVFAASAQEVLGSCIFLFVKHPYDIGDRVELNDRQLTVEHISLLFTVFRQIQSNQLVQIPNIVLNTLWVENVSRSKAMKEQFSIFVDFTTSFEDIQLLKAEMSKFLIDKENNRDFFSDVDIQVLSIAQMDKLELQIEVSHKSNWANETVRSARRSKFMCALVSAIRKIPINGPAGADAALGSVDNPTYSVAVSDSAAAKNRDTYAQGLEAGRFVPSKKSETRSEDRLAPPSEARAIDQLNSRSPALDHTRDEALGSSTGRDRDTKLDEVRGLLRRSTTKGRRKSTRSAKSLESSNSPNPAMELGLTRTPSGPQPGGPTIPAATYSGPHGRGTDDELNVPQIPPTYAPSGPGNYSPQPPPPPRK